MNQFLDQAIIISVRAHGESGAVIHVLTEDHGKCGGYVNGAQASSRLRSTLQPGNIVNVDWQSKSEGQLGRFDVELEQDISASLFSDAKSLLAVQSACALIDMFLPDREKQDALFHGTCALMNIMKTDQWPAVYITWEMAFLKEMGYGIDISKCAVSGVEGGLTHVSPKSGRAVCAAEAEPYKDKLLEIPSFMREGELSDDDITKGLKLTGYFLMHRLLQHSSYHALPDARHQLENSMDSV